MWVSAALVRVDQPAQRILGRQDGVELAEVNFATGRARIQVAPDVVLTDLRMPGMDGLEATKLIREKVPETAVLIFTAYSERSLLSRGLESGAKGYILKEAPHETLLRAIEKVAAGETFVDPALMPS